MKLYKEIANVTGWVPLTDEFKIKKMDKIDRLSSLLPSGSGIDSCTIDEEESTGNRIVIHSAFLHMNENGFYSGWSKFDVIITPDLFRDFNLKIVGRKAIYPAFSETKEYLYDVFYNALSEGMQ